MWRDAAYRDVQMKAVRLRNEGKVTVLRIDPTIAAGKVIGDSGNAYNVVIERQDPSSYAVSLWECECVWSQYAWGPVHKGRMCSHALALLYEIQSRENRKDSPDYRWRKVEGSAPYPIRLAMALIREDDLPSNLRRTIEEFRKMPNVWRLEDPAQAEGLCGTVSYDFATFARQRGHSVEVRNLREDPWKPSWKGREFDLYEGRCHQVVYVDGYYIDWSARQYDPTSPVPRVYKGLEDSIGFTHFYRVRDERPDDRHVRFVPGVREDIDPRRAVDSPPLVMCDKKHSPSGRCWEIEGGHVPEEACICPRGPVGAWANAVSAFMKDCPVHGDDAHRIKRGDPRLHLSSLQGYVRDPHDTLYPPVFEDDRVKPVVRERLRNYILEPLSERFVSPESWLRFYIYGSGASYDWDESGDLDVQVFVDEDRFWSLNPDANLDGHTVVSTVRRTFADKNFRTLEQLGLEGDMTVQYYAKSGQGTHEQVLSERPYAAYDLDEDVWVVKPEPMGADFFARLFERSMAKAQMLAEHIGALITAYDVDVMSAEYWGAMAERDPEYEGDKEKYRQEAESDYRRLKSIYDSIHRARNKAYGPQGMGNLDERDAVYKMLLAWDVLPALERRVKEGVPWRDDASCVGKRYKGRNQNTMVALRDEEATQGARRR